MREWKDFGERGEVEGLKLVWVEGMKSACKAWDNLAEGAIKGDIGLDKGFLFKL